MKKQKKNSFEEKFKDFLDNADVTDLKGGSPDEIVLKAMKPLLEKMMNAEMDEHLGYKNMKLVKYKIQEMVILRNLLKVYLVQHKLKHQEIETLLLNQ